MVACTTADDASGFKFGVDGISGLPGDASRSIFGGGRLRWVDIVRIGGGGGSMIRHAVAPAACPVGPVPVSVIVPSLLAFLVFTLWRSEFVARAFSAGIGDCSICGPCNNDGRSRTPGHSRSPGKTVDAVVLHGSPWRRFRRAGTTATEQGKRDLIYRGWSVRFFGPVQKARSAPAGRGCPIPVPAYRSRRR